MAKMTCPHCGAENPRSLVATLCSHCGKSLGGREEAPAPPEPPAPPSARTPPDGSASVTGRPHAHGSEFRMTVEDVFGISGRGTVACGHVAQGVLRVGDELLVERASGPTLRTRCTNLEADRRGIEEAHPGDNVGVFLEGVSPGQVRRGDVLRAAGPSDAPQVTDGPTRLAWILGRRGIEPVPPAVEAEIEALLRQQQVILAIKRLRDERPGLGLKEAKDIIDEFVAGVFGRGPTSSGKCFIATAACGTAHAPAVGTLQEFREAVLRPTRLGRALIGLYERLSPGPARLIARSAPLRALLRQGVIGPAAWMAGRELRRRR